jgi:hypothetical protein
MAQNNSFSDVYSSSSSLVDSSSSSLVDSLSLSVYDLFLSICGFIFHYNVGKYNLLNLFLIYLSFLSFSYFPNLSVFNIFIFLYRIFFISFYCQSCDLWYLVFFHLFFLFSYPYFLIFDISILFHGSIDHASTITGYVSIVMTFVTLNVTCNHIGMVFLNISFIIHAICNLMSKFSTKKQ